MVQPTGPSCAYYCPCAWVYQLTWSILGCNDWYFVSYNVCIQCYLCLNLFFFFLLYSFACATFISTLAEINGDFVGNAKTNIGIYAAVLVAQGLINTFGVHLLKYLNNISVWWHALGTTSLVIAILAKAPSHQTAKWVFTQFIDGTGVDGAPGWGARASNAYVVVIGVLMAQYTLTGMFIRIHK
jgi:amino acid transporter